MTLQAILAFILRHYVLDDGAVSEISPVGKVHMVLVGLYGIRLCGFLVWRNSLASYKAFRASGGRKSTRSSSGSENKKPIPKFVLFVMMVTCSVLYTAMFVPASYNFVPGGEKDDAWGVVGVSIATVALLTEMLVDIDNQLYYERMSGEERKERGNNWNYYAEASFWIGGFVAAKSRYDVWKFVRALPGVCGIVWIVMSEAARRRARWAESHQSSRESKKVM